MFVRQRQSVHQSISTAAEPGLASAAIGRIAAAIAATRIAVAASPEPVVAWPESGTARPKAPSAAAAARFARQPVRPAAHAGRDVVAAAARGANVLALPSRFPHGTTGKRAISSAQFDGGRRQFIGPAQSEFPHADGGQRASTVNGRPQFDQRPRSAHLCRPESGHRAADGFLLAAIATACRNN